MKRGKFRQGKIPTYSRASEDGSQADRGNAALKLQMKRLLGNQFVRRENSRLAIRGFTISERGSVEMREELTKGFVKICRKYTSERKYTCETTLGTGSTSR